MVKKKIAKKVIKKRSKIKIKNEEKQRQKITNYDKDKTIHYKKQKPWQTHCHLCHKLISRTHYHSHIKHNHKNIFTGNLTEGDNNNTYIHSSSYSYFKKEDNGNNVADIPKMKKWNTNIFLEKSNKNNILSNDFYSYNKEINKSLSYEGIEWPKFEKLYKGRNLKSVMIYKNNYNNHFAYYEFKEINNYIKNSKTKYEIPEFIKDMPKEFSIFATMKEYDYVKALIRDNHREYMLNDLKETKNHYLNCFKIDIIDKEYLNWKATINLTSKNKKYKKIVNIHINFPTTYPFESPIITRMSRISDINIFSSSGNLMEKYDYIKFSDYDEEDGNQNEINDSKNDFEEPIPRKNYCCVCKKIFLNYKEHIKREKHLTCIDKKIIKQIKETFKNISLNNIKRNKRNVTINKNNGDVKDYKNDKAYSISNFSYLSETPSYLKESFTNETIIEMRKSGIVPRIRHIYTIRK